MRQVPDIRFRLAVRAVAALAVLAGVVFVLSKAVAPGGFLTVRTDLRDPAPFVSEPKPGDRLEVVRGGGAQSLLDSPLYLDLDPPGEYDSVTVEVRYRNFDQPLLEIGALANRLDGQFDMRTAESRLIDSLQWHRVSSDSLTLYERKREHLTVDSFLSDPPDIRRVATYRASVDWPYRLPEHVSGGRAEHQVSLRGSHRMLTLADSGSLSANFSVQDMNRQDGADPVTVSVFREGDDRALARTVLDDDGNTRGDQRSSGLRNVSVSIPDAEPGVYLIDFVASDDVFIRSSSFGQRHVVFVDSLYLGDHVGYSDRLDPAVVLVHGRQLTVKTAHVEGLQEMRVGDAELLVREPHVLYPAELDTSEGPAVVLSPRRDVYLRTDGVMSLDAADFFIPRPLEIAWSTTADDLDRAGVDYVLSDYEPPRTEGESSVAVASFDLSELDVTEDGTYRFALAAPGIGLTGRSLKIESVTFVLKREPVGWAEGLRRFLSESGLDRRGSGMPAALPHGVRFGETVP